MSINPSSLVDLIAASILMLGAVSCVAIVCFTFIIRWALESPVVMERIPRYEDGRRETREENPGTGQG